MDCQSGCPLKSVNFAYFRGASLDSACPAQGSASIWAEARRTKIETLWRYRDIPSVSIGISHANCRKFMCARKARR
jgi:hypothetical protein